MSLLSVKDVQSGYGNIAVLKCLSLDIQEGQIVAMIGANGAGKTTTLKTISGILKATKGAIHFDGADITNRKPYDMAKLGIAQVPEGRQVFPELSVNDNLILGGYSIQDKHVVAGKIEEMFDRFPRLKERRKQEAGTLSGGEQQMVALARALISGPKLILLDEPSMGLSPRLVDEVFEIIVDLRKQGITALLVEQNAHMALSIADYAYVIQTGQIIMEGEGKAMMVNEEIRKAYLAE